MHRIASLQGVDKVHGQTLLGLLLYILLFIGQNAPAATNSYSFSITTNHYRVYGQSGNDILKSIAQNIPWKGKHTWHAHTTWQVKWRFTTLKQEELFYVRSVTTDADAVITLPWWYAGTNTPPQVTADWQRYYKALLHHELEHARFASATASEMQKRIFRIPPQSTQAELAALVKQTGDAIMKEFRKREVEFDRLTAHGMNQGAQFRTYTPRPQPQVRE